MWYNEILIMKKPKPIITENLRKNVDFTFPIELELEGFSVSVNHLYGKSKFGVYMKRAGKELRYSTMKSICSQLDIPYTDKLPKGKSVGEVIFNYENKPLRDKMLRVTYVFHSRWLTLEGDILISDSDNRIKFIQDCIFDSLNIDDCTLFETYSKKIHEPDSSKYKIKVLISCI